MHSFALPPTRLNLSERTMSSEREMEPPPPPSATKPREAEVRPYSERPGFYLNQPPGPTPTEKAGTLASKSENSLNPFLPLVTSLLYLGKPHPTATFLYLLPDIIQCFYLPHL